MLCLANFRENGFRSGSRTLGLESVQDVNFWLGIQTKKKPRSLVAYWIILVGYKKTPRSLLDQESNLCLGFNAQPEIEIYNGL